MQFCCLYRQLNGRVTSARSTGNIFSAAGNLSSTQSLRKKRINPCYSRETQFIRINSRIYDPDLVGGLYNPPHPKLTFPRALVRDATPDQHGTRIIAASEIDVNFTTTKSIDPS